MVWKHFVLTFCFCKFLSRDQVSAQVFDGKFEACGEK